MNRLFKASVIISAAFSVTLIATLALSCCLESNSLRPGFAVTPQFHVGVSDGAFYSYSHILFSGGTFSIVRGGEPSPVRERVVAFPGGHYVAVHYPTATVWVLQVSLLCPIILSAVLPLIWLYRARHRQAPNQLAPANSRRPIRFRWPGRIRRSLASSGLGSPAAVAERER